MRTLIFYMSNLKSGLFQYIINKYTLLLIFERDTIASSKVAPLARRQVRLRRFLKQSMRALDLMSTELKKSELSATRRVKQAAKKQGAKVPRHHGRGNRSS